MRWLVGLMGGLVVVGACGGKAVIDPPLGNGGSGSTSRASTSNASVTVTTSTGDPITPCEELAQEYRELVEEAKACDSEIDVPQCGDLIPDDLQCPCSTSVDFSNVDALLAIGDVIEEYNDRNCFDELGPCPPVACEQVDGGVCEDDRCENVGNN